MTRKMAALGDTVVVYEAGRIQQVMDLKDGDLPQTAAGLLSLYAA